MEKEMKKVYYVVCENTNSEDGRKSAVMYKKNKMYWTFNLEDAFHYYEQPSCFPAQYVLRVEEEVVRKFKKMRRKK